MGETKILEQKKSVLRAKIHLEQWPFQPDIGEFNRELGKIDDNHEAFINRMTNSKKVSQEAIESLRQEIRGIEDNYDQKTGQPLYVPKISKYENSENIDRKMSKYESIFEALYEEARILKEKREILVTQHEQKEESQYMKQVSTSDRNNYILYQMWTKKIQNLFDTLDSDYDGVISSQKIDISALSNELLDVLTPLLLKIEEYALVLDFDQFLGITLDFWKWLSHPDRTLILGENRETSKYRSAPEEFSHTPHLSDNTRAIVELGDYNSRRSPLYERSKVISEKENVDMHECTFKPSIKDYDSKKYQKGIKSKMNLKETLVESMFGPNAQV